MKSFLHRTDLPLKSYIADPDQLVLYVSEGLWATALYSHDKGDTYYDVWCENLEQAQALYNNRVAEYRALPSRGFDAANRKPEGR